VASVLLVLQLMVLLVVLLGSASMVPSVSAGSVNMSFPPFWYHAGSHWLLLTQSVAAVCCEFIADYRA
jgi:hypothetical protein